FRHIRAGPPDNYEEPSFGDPHASYEDYASGATQHAFVDEWGIKWRRAAYYYDMVEHPLAGASLEDLKAYRWPDPHDPGKTRGLREKARDLYLNTDYALVADPASGGILEMALWTRGFEDFYIDLGTHSKFATILLDGITEYFLAWFGEYLDTVGDYIQIIAQGDDLGMQDRMLLPPNLYRKYIKPRHQKVIELIKSKTRAKVFHHSCGAIVPVIGDLIEISVDILNPIQPRAEGMNTWELKRVYGHSITFHGGVDVQTVLPRGTADDVVEEVKERIASLGPGGGYILAASHNIQADVPPENIVAMFEAAHEYGQYPLQIELSRRSDAS
ncbi:uroporphyrinogen decarboxylase family protein, partial [Candidatus Hakubella thermalkaliphila]